MPPGRQARTGIPLMAALTARTRGFTAGVNTNISVLTTAAIFTPKRDWAPARYD
jgi:hypothetical protein